MKNYIGKLVKAHDDTNCEFFMFVTYDDGSAGFTRNSVDDNFLKGCVFLIVGLTSDFLPAKHIQNPDKDIALMYDNKIYFLLDIVYMNFAKNFEFLT